MRILLVILWCIPAYMFGQNDFPDFSKAINGDKIVDLFNEGTPPKSVEIDTPVYLKSLKETFPTQNFDFEMFFEHEGILYSLLEGNDQYPVYYFSPAFEGNHYIRAEYNGCVLFLKFNESEEIKTHMENCLN